MPSYPDSTRAFVRRQDKVDVNYADDINDLQEELTAVQKTLGRNPQVSSTHKQATTVSDRLAFIEQDYDPRLDDLEKRLRRAAVSVELRSDRQFNHSEDWQPLVLPDMASQLNDFGPRLYDREAGRFFSIAPAPGLWAFSASVTWMATLGARGTRGLAVRTAGGTVLAMEKQAALEGQLQTLSISWTGRLTEDPQFFLELMVRQDQGTAVFLKGNADETPCRADFVHLVG